MGQKSLFFRICRVIAGKLAGSFVALVSFVTVTVWAAPAAGGDLFFDDFEDMTANRWHVGGDGTVEVVAFGEGESLQLTKRGYALAAVRIDGQFAVKIEVGMAANSLEKADHCVAEASADGGAEWMDVLRLYDSEDDGETWHYGDAELMLPGPMSTLAIRLRSEGDSNNDYCWADDVRVTVLDAISP
ncbi:MAG: hypothetical protein EP340_04815 [Alphaproteobacteria bacterium]|nr:MAG: hypothetical protein EP340_04815 [Alphaproteobacteria bacterium]